MKLRCAIALSVATLALSGAAAVPGAKPAEAGDQANPKKPIGDTVGRIADVTQQFAQVAAATGVSAPSIDPPKMPAETAPAVRAANGAEAAKPTKAAAGKAAAAAKHGAKIKLAAPSGEKITEPASRKARRAQTAAAEQKPMLVRCVGRTETGKAAWYGGRYIGRQTSSGERLDTIHATAAHRTLPLNSLARVTNLANGRSVIVRVTDRGPISESLLIDMSPRAAEELAMKDAGIVPVKVEQVVEVASDAK